jgi:hypothetical protein
MNLLALVVGRYGIAYRLLPLQIARGDGIAEKRWIVSAPFSGRQRNGNGAFAGITEIGLSAERLFITLTF